jgi:hypothetical protein
MGWTAPSRETRPKVLPSAHSLSHRPWLGVLLVGLVAGSLVTGPPALASGPSVILDRPRVGEYQPVRRNGWIAWQQNTSGRPRHYDVLVRPMDGGSTVRVNADGRSGANGDIEGDLLVYQQFGRGFSSLRFFDLASHTRTTPPQGVNSEQWEYWPSMSGSWLLFGRLFGNGARRVILFNLSTSEQRVVDRVRGEHAYLAPGQVNGDWAVWSRCAPGQACDVVRYRISTDRAHTVANPLDVEQYAPSVDDHGTVYFANREGDCGGRVKLIRQRRGRGARELWRLPNGDDIGRTYVLARPRSNRVLFDHFACGEAGVSDAWQLIDLTSYAHTPGGALDA